MMRSFVGWYPWVVTKRLREIAVCQIFFSDVIHKNEHFLTNFCNFTKIRLISEQIEIQPSMKAFFNLLLPLFPSVYRMTTFFQFFKKLFFATCSKQWCHLSCDHNGKTLFWETSAICYFVLQ